MRAKSRKLNIERLDSRVLLAADVATLPDASPVDDHGRNEIQVCFDHEAQQVLHGKSEDAADSESWPDLIALPTGFEPKTIETGRGHEFFVGAYSWSSVLGPRVGQFHDPSPDAGAIYKGDLHSGEGGILVAPRTEAEGGPIAILGLSYDSRTDYLYASFGGATPGTARYSGIAIYNGTTGELVDEVMVSDNAFLSNILVTRSAVYATATNQGVLFKVPLAQGGRLPSTLTVETIELKDFDPANNFYAWGLAGAFDGKELIVLNGLNGSGVLYRVDTATGVSTPLTIRGAQQSFVRGDDLYLRGRTLYIAQTFEQSVAVIQLSGDLSEGTFVKNIACGECSTPHSATGFGDSIYAVSSNVLFNGADDDRIFGDSSQIQSSIVKLPM